MCQPECLTIILSMPEHNPFCHCIHYGVLLNSWFLLDSFIETLLSGFGISGIWLSNSPPPFHLISNWQLMLFSFFFLMLFCYLKDVLRYATSFYILLFNQAPIGCTMQCWLTRIYSWKKWPMWADFHQWPLIRSSPIIPKSYLLIATWNPRLSPETIREHYCRTG